MDMSSFWKQFDLNFHSNLGHCWVCPCTKHDDHDFLLHELQELCPEFRFDTVLPIGNDRTVFCVLHAKMRVTDKMMNALAAVANEKGQLAHFTEAIQSISHKGQ